MAKHTSSASFARWEVSPTPFLGSAMFTRGFPEKFPRLGMQEKSFNTDTRGAKGYLFKPGDDLQGIW